MILLLLLFRLKITKSQKSLTRSFDITYDTPKNNFPTYIFIFQMTSLDREAIMDMFRTLSMFQIHRKMTTPSNHQKDGRIFPSIENYQDDTIATQLQTRVDDQISTLRPMLTSALAAIS